MAGDGHGTGPMVGTDLIDDAGESRQAARLLRGVCHKDARKGGHRKAGTG